MREKMSTEPQPLMIEKFPNHKVYPDSAYSSGYQDIDHLNRQIMAAARFIEVQAQREGHPFLQAELESSLR